MNGDLGSDAGTVSINLMAKASELVLDAIKSLIQGLYQIYKDSPQMKLDMIKLKEAKTEKEKIEVLKKMNGVDGYIKAKKLEKYCDATGTRVIPRNIEFVNESQKRMFLKVATEQHLLFSMVQDKENPLKTTILISNNDMELLNRCCDLTNDMLKVETIENKIADIMGDKSITELTDGDKYKVDVLNAEKATINAKWTNAFNLDAYDRILSEVLLPSHGEKKYEADRIDFDYKTFNNDTYSKNDAFASALDSDVSKTLSKDRYSVVASTVDPNRFVICHSENNPNKNSAKKIITTYEVYNGKQDENGKNVSKVFSDAKVNVKQWIETRKQMKTFGRFGNEDLIRFDSVTEFDNWRTFADKQNAVEEVRVFNDGELQQAVQKRTEELQTKGFEVRENGEIYDSKSGKSTQESLRELDNAIKKSKSPSELLELQSTKAKIAEIVLIGKEISNYEALVKVNNNLATVKTNLTIAELNKDTDKIASCNADINSLTQSHKEFTAEKESLIEQRKTINSVQADMDRQVLENAYQFSKTDTKSLVQISKDFEKNGFGKADEFMNTMNKSDFKGSVMYLTRLSVDVGKVISEEKNKGNNVNSLSDFRNKLVTVQNDFLGRIKKVEPTAFPYIKNNSLDGESLKLAKSLGGKMEDMKIAEKDEFVNKVENTHGNERIDTINTYKDKAVNETENKDEEMERSFDDLMRLEFDKGEVASRESVENIGDISDDKNIGNEQNIEKWKDEIKDRKDADVKTADIADNTHVKSGKKNTKAER